MSKHTCLALCFGNLEKGFIRAEVLLVLEPNLSSSDKDGWRWSLPGGKCCDSRQSVNCCFEPPQATIIRECREETGFEVTRKKLLLEEDRATPVTGEKFKRYVYLVSIVGGRALRKKVFGQESPKWFSLSSLPRNLFYSHRKIIEGFVLSNIISR